MPPGRPRNQLRDGRAPPGADPSARARRTIRAGAIPQRQGGTSSMRTTRVALAAIGAALVVPATAGAATYTVSAGPPQNAAMPTSFAAGLYDGAAFYPGSRSPLKIHKGDKVKFVGGFHTATILGSTPRGGLELIQPDPAHGTYAPVNDQQSPTPQPFYWGGLPKFVYN